MLSDIETTSPVRMRGWHHGADLCRSKIDAGEMIHLLAETSNICDQDCEYRYTWSPAVASPASGSRSSTGSF